MTRQDIISKTQGRCISDAADCQFIVISELRHFYYLRCFIAHVHWLIKSMTKSII